MVITEPFAHDTDFFTEFGNDGTNALFQWRGGRLRLTKLIKGWNLAGLVQTEPVLLASQVSYSLDITLITNVVGNAQATDENSTTLLNLNASSTTLPETPALVIETYGFSISGGKAAIQNGTDGAQVFDELVEGERYEIIHTIEMGNGRMAVSCIGENQPGFLGYVQNSNSTYPDFRDYVARLNYQPYYTDTIHFHGMKITGL